MALVFSRIGMSNLLGFSLLESGASASRCARCDASCVALLSPVGHTGWAGGGKPVRSQVRLLLLATLILVGGDLPQWVVLQEVGRCRSGSCGYHCRASSVAALLAEGGSGGGVLHRQVSGFGSCSRLSCGFVCSTPTSAQSRPLVLMVLPGLC